MKPFYKLLFSIVVLPVSAFAQMAVRTGDDYVQVVSNTTGTVVQNVLLNDVFSFSTQSFVNPLLAADVTFSVVSQSNPSVSLVGKSVVITGAVPDGVYTIDYQICRNANLGQCDSATVTVKVGGSAMVAPTLSFTQASACSQGHSLTVNGLPAGNWLIDVERSGIWHMGYSGSGSDFVLPEANITAGYDYRVKVIDPVTMAVSSYSDWVNLPVYECELSQDVVSSYEDYNNDGIVNAGDHINHVITIANAMDVPYTFFNVDVDGYAMVPINEHNYPDLTFQQSTVFTGSYELTAVDVERGAVVNGFLAVADNGGAATYEYNFYKTVYLDVNLNKRDFAADRFAVYPNPAHEVEYIDVASAQPKTFEIVDLLGHTVQSGRSESMHSTLDVSGLPNGIYLLTVKQNDVVQTTKFIKR